MIDNYIVFIIVSGPGGFGDPGYFHALGHDRTELVGKPSDRAVFFVCVVLNMDGKWKKRARKS